MVVQECSGLTAGAITQSVKGLPHDHKDLNSVPQSPCKKPGMVASAWGDETGRALGLGDETSRALELGDETDRALGLGDGDRQSPGVCSTSQPCLLVESQARERDSVSKISI